jgi:hypothetical protein
VETDVGVTGSYKITLGAPTLKYITPCTGGTEGCVNEVGIAQVPVESDFKFALTIKASYTAEINIAIDGLNLKKGGGVKGGFEFTTELNTGGSSQADILVSCEPLIPAPIPIPKK